MKNPNFHHWFPLFEARRTDRSASGKRARLQAGFTLLETVVAVTILAFGIVGPMVLAHQSIRSAREAQARLTAVSFAQEGVEIVRNIIANNSADYDPDYTRWLEDIVGGAADCETRCIADMREMAQSTFANILVGCPSASCSHTNIYQDPVSGFYTQALAAPAGWITTPYTREIVVTEMVSNKQARVFVTVTWARGSVTLQEDIYNWFLPLS